MLKRQGIILEDPVAPEEAVEEAPLPPREDTLFKDEEKQKVCSVVWIVLSWFSVYISVTWCRMFILLAILVLLLSLSWLPIDLFLGIGRFIFTLLVLS